jgi:hypothetical protein
MFFMFSDHFYSSGMMISPFAVVIAIGGSGGSIHFSGSSSQESSGMLHTLRPEMQILSWSSLNLQVATNYSTVD